MLYMYILRGLYAPQLMYAMRRSCTLYMPPIQALSGGGAWGCAHLLGGGRDPPTGLAPQAVGGLTRLKPLLLLPLTRARAREVRAMTSIFGKYRTEHSDPTFRGYKVPKVLRISRIRTKFGHFWTFFTEGPIGRGQNRVKKGYFQGSKRSILEDLR